MYGVVASTVMDEEVASSTRELSRALEEQARELNVVLSRLSEARLLMPTTTDSDWRGFAQIFYCLALVRLRSDLDAAHEQLSNALRETRHAVDSLGSRVG